MVCLRFYSGFGGQELETTVKSKKNNQNSILRDSLIFLGFFFIFTVVLVVCRCFWWFVLVFTVVLVVKSSKPL